MEDGLQLTHKVCTSYTCRGGR